MNFNQSLDLLDRLSIQQRGKRLEPLEREILGVAWENGSYLEIEGFQEQTVKNKAVKLWKYLSQLLHTKVNKYNLRQVLAELDSELPISPIVNIDRHRRSRFYGRLTELWQLQSWVESERRKLIFIHGMKGIGKTALVRKLAENLAPRLDRVVWISLEAAPSLIDVLAIIIKELDGGRNAKLSKNLQTAIDKTIGYLRNNRCLLVFDNADLVLVQDESSTSDLARDYTQFFDRLNSVASDSYCLTISTEKCWMRTIDRQLELQGLDRQSCQDLIQTSELVGTIAEWDTLIDRYQGNPQYLKIVASTITDIFAGKIEKFLTANILVYQPIETLLAQQLDLLSNAEMSILLWLAIEREPIDLDRLQLVTSVSITGTNTVKILDKLVRKYLVEVQDHLFTLPELIMESVTARYQDLVDEGITAKKFNILHLYPIILSAKTVNTNKDRAGNTIDKLHQNLQCNLTSIISRLLFRGRSTPPPQRNFIRYYVSIFAAEIEA
jgi:DNA-binding MarR family transcriptional regulator